MDISASQCSSSGCESGWTLYLDQSSLSKNHQFQHYNEEEKEEEEEEEEEEDLSMVSDASSGPPHYSEFYDDGYSFNHHHLPNINKKLNTKKKTKEFGRNQHQYSYLDDTASSHVLSKKAGMNNEASMENVLEFSQGFSATHFKGKSSFKNPFGFFQSSLAEKPASTGPGGFQGRKWK